MKLFKLFIMAISLFLFYSVSYSGVNKNVENILGGLEINKHTIKDATKLLGSNCFKFAEPPANLATYVWFDKGTDLLIYVQLPTVDLNTNEVINTIILSYQMPVNSLKLLKNIDRKKYTSKLDLSKIKTSLNIKIGADIEEVFKVYGKPFSYMDHTTHEFINPDHYIFWYSGEKMGVFTVITSKKNNKVIELQVHYADW